MSLVWHIVRKDLRRLALPLALWSVLLIARTELGVDLLQGNGVDFAHFDLVRLGHDMLLAADGFVGVILAALLVQEDPLVGTQMFWATRPIGGGRLLAAKLLGAALMFGVPPVVFSLRLWLACAYGPRELVRGALGVIDQQALVVVAGFAFAALTATIGRFLAALSGALLGGALLSYLGGAITAGLDGRYAPHWPILIGFITLPVLGLAVVWQFCFRRRARPVWLVVAVGVLAVILLAGAPWHPTSWWSRPGERRETQALAVAVTGAQAENSYSDNDRHVRVDLKVTGLPAELGMRVRLRAFWQQADGSQAGGTDSGVSELKPTLGVYRALGLSGKAVRDTPHVWTGLTPSAGLRLEDDTANESRLVAHLPLRRRDVQALMQEPAPFAGRAELNFVRPELLLEIPPESGRAAHHHGYGVRITKAVWNDQGVLIVTGVETQPAAATVRPGLIFFLGRRNGWVSDTFYAVVNRAGDWVGHPAVTFSEPWIGAGQAVRWFTATLDTRERMNGSTLDLLRLEPAGTAQREFHLPTLPVAPPPPVE